ncbi:MAG: YybH family protein [Xanthobacteraceae bacterium]
MKPNPQEIAAAFARRWENAWNSEGAAATAKLYTPDALLVGMTIAAGRGEIESALDRLFQQGWSKISINVVQAREVAGVVLVAGEFSAFGSGPNAGKVLNGRSTHVLTQIGNTWLSAMHSAN